MIAVRGLRKSYGRKAALDGIDLDVREGERVAIVGPNGSGKTTLMRCILGLVRYEGTVTVAGHDATVAHAAAQVHVAYVPQRAPSLPVPVNELVRFWAEQRDVRARELTSSCARLGLDLDGVWGQPFPSLSGGMQQKLLAGMALASRCQGMLLDEPTANLDPGARAVFFADLGARTPPPMLLLSSHRLDELCPLVDRVVVLTDGQIAFDDSLHRFLAEPALAAAAGMEMRAGAAVLPYRRRS